MLLRSIALGAALIASTGMSSPLVRFVDETARVRLRHPASLRPGTKNDLANYFNNGGWRLSWDRQPVGPGTIVVNFQDSGLDNRHGDYADVIGEYVQVGMSRDPAVVASCGTAGLTSDGERFPNRMLGGHRWTVYRHGDAGMSKSVSSLDYRTVVDGVCYAITRLTYGAHGIEDFPKSLPPVKVAAARIDAILTTIKVGRPR